MGILRVYLALCVITAHSHHVFPWSMHGGKAAVQIFYIISGFYMAMVLSTKYTNIWGFYESRFMRIFPLYWIALGATLIVCSGVGLATHRWLLLQIYRDHPLLHNGPAGILLACIVNITIVGQDWLMFLKDDFGQGISLTRDFHTSASPLCHYLLLPQSWSIGLELIFYACVPFLNRLRSYWLVSIALAALTARLIAYDQFGLAHDPWDYRFFPFEISLFIFGMLAYRLYMKTKSSHPPQRFRCISNLSYLFGAMAILIFLFLHLKVMEWAEGILGPEMGILITYPFWILILPVVFFAFGNQKADRVIGELSYPIYLVHYLVIPLVNMQLNPFGIRRETGACSAVVSVVIAGFIYRFIIVPLDAKRHALAQSMPPGHMALKPQ